ncbi:MAG: multidrug efflux SMR transporter [Micrococcales bacterium]|nr:multidrug efflux SMR transporter [Micrococcales bacterium]
MYWPVLILSGVLEAVWATALSASDGFRRPGATLVFVVAVALSMIGLAYALIDIPTGTAYAVWVAIGVVGTVLLAVVRGEEQLGLARGLLLVMLIVSVVGLKLVGARDPS